MKIDPIVSERLAASGQSHLLQFWSTLDETRRANLLSQLKAIDFELINRLFRGEEEGIDWSAMANRARPPKAVRLQDVVGDRVELNGRKCTRSEATRLGEEAIRSGQIGMILLAGGQGTRLCFDHPKGMYTIGPLSNRTLFQIHIDQLKAVRARYGAAIPLIVMTSPATDLETRDYFAAQQNFGFTTSEMSIICQGTMPAIERETGKVLLSGPGQIALSPDGHGGLLGALQKDGILDEYKSRGLTHFFYGQVDNPLIPWCDPEMIGYHLFAQSQMTSVVVQKRFAEEKVGNVVEVDGRMCIIEYSDLPKEPASKLDENGGLLLWAGNIAVHLFDLDFLRSVAIHADGLPFHCAKKPVPYVDSEGKLVRPNGPNGLKFERFIFDLLPHAERALAIEGDPSKVFAPVKNGIDAPTDSPLTCRRAIVDLHRGWLESAGASVGDGVQIEIHPEWALDELAVKKRILPGTQISTDTYFVS